MYAGVVCSPPLGATTVVEANGNPLTFIAVLELAKQQEHELDVQEIDEESLDVQLWYGADGDLVWHEARFSAAEPSLLTVLKQSPSKRQKYFSLSLDYSGARPLNFTLRFRTSPTSPWLWASNYGPTSDGRLLLQSPRHTVRFSDLFENTASSITVSVSPSQIPGVTIYTVNAPTSANSTSTIPIGVPTAMERYFALVQVESPWIGPRHGRDKITLDKDALVVGFVRVDGMYVIILGLAAVDTCTTYIATSGNGVMVLKTRNDGASIGVYRAVVAVGSSWQKALHATFYRARELVVGYGAVCNKAEGGDVRAQWRHEWYDGFAYCTWNGLGREITEQGVLSVLQDLADNGIQVSTLIIDDNWQTLISRKWDKFEADPVQFPRGLKATITTIKERFPHIKYVSVWHTIFGYWDGVAPGGWVDRNYKCETVKWHGGCDVRVITTEDVERCFDDFYSFLSSCGVDGVKADAQCSLGELDSATDRQRIGRAYQDAFKLASLKHFSRSVIYCMSMQPFILLYSLLPLSSSRLPVLRNSDDFFPDIPSSHPWHIFANAMNSLYTSNLNALPDWDMFQSSLPTYGTMHAAARCISGGPIYITDCPGKHNISLIKQLTGKPIGSEGLISLRPSRVALVSDPFIEYNGTQLLRVENFVGGKGGAGLLAIFNTAVHPITELILLKDFPGVIQGERYIIRAFSTDTVTDIGVLGDPEPKSISIALPPCDWEFLTAARVIPLGEHFVGTLGLMDKIAGAAAVVEQVVKLPETSVQKASIAVKVKALGKLGFYISNLASRDASRFMITLSGNPVPFETVSKGTQPGTARVLYFDLEAAWAELNLSAPWSGEVEVKLYLSV